MSVPPMVLIGFLCVAISPAMRAGDSPLEVTRLDTGVRLNWRPAAGGLERPTEFRLQRTTDLRAWENLGDKARRPAGLMTGLTAEDTSGMPHAFYRLLARPGVSFTSGDAAEVLGLGGIYQDELSVLQDLTPQGLAERHPGPRDYLPSITFDPTQSAFWDLYSDPAPLQTNRGIGGVKVTPGFSFALDPRELERMRTNGFVVSERLGAADFGEIYYRIFSRDLPVLITSDSVLHAWHRSYDALLVDMERGYLTFALEDLLAGMAAEVPAAFSAYGSGILNLSLEDADFFLTTARSLLAGHAVASGLGQDARVARTLASIQKGDYEPFTLFDKDDYVDFSQFKPRGHYPRHGLDNYFRTMMWCGRVDLRVAGNAEWASLRQLGTAIVLQDLWQRSGRVTRWRDLNRVLEVFVGRSDSMNLDQLHRLLRARGLEDPARITSPDQLETLWRDVESGVFGIQEIQGHSYLNGAGGQGKLPRSFTLLGQRFTLDSWAMGQCSFDRIIVPHTDPPEFIRRRRSYSLDVAFSVFGNDHVVPELVANMLNSQGVPFRDGFPYGHNLAAVRATVDQLPAAAWEDSIYSLWLAALRELSAPTTGPEYPQAMRTRAWAMKTLTTQLASWTQLRHDTVLYVKGTEVPPILCFYPAGLVEPRPAFFAALQKMTTRAEQLIASLEFSLGSDTVIEPYGTPALMQTKVGAFLRRFGHVCGTLESIARRELAQEPLTEAETALIDNWMEILIGYFGERQYNGHYPGLFLRGAEGKLPDPQPSGTLELIPHDCSQPDELVVDVLTAGFSDPDGDPGAVLHQAVGGVNLLMMAVDNGPDRMIFAGPVFSHYEFERPLGNRLTDEAWKGLLKSGPVPAPPPWTQSYLVPASESGAGL